MLSVDSFSYSTYKQSFTFPERRYIVPECILYDNYNHQSVENGVAVYYIIRHKTTRVVQPLLVYIYSDKIIANELMNSNYGDDDAIDI